MGREGLINGHTFPTGAQVFAGVPFLLGSEGPGDYAWNAHYAAGDNPRTLDIPVNVYGVTTVYTLMNTYWGSTTPNLAAIRFIGSDDADWTYWLLGNTDIRDYNQAAYTNQIQFPTIMVFDNSLGQRLDRQRFILPATFHDETLLTVQLLDYGDYVVQRLFIAGLTVETADQVAPIPEPSTALLLGLGLIVLGLASRRRLNHQI